MQNKKIKLIATICMALFSTVSVVTGTVAWFHAEHTSHSAANNLRITGNSPFVSDVAIYTMADEDVERIYNTTPAATFTADVHGFVQTSGTTDPISMGVYSQVDSTVKSIYIVATIASNFVGKDNHADFWVNSQTTTAEEDSLVYLDTSVSPARIKNPLKDPEGSGSHDNPLSSVMSFSAFPMDTIKTDLSHETLEMSSFVEMDGNGYTYSQDLNLYNCPDGSAFPSYIGIVCEYNAAAFEYIYTENIGNEALERETPIHFAVDWLMVL